MTLDEIIGFKKSSKINGLKLDETCRTPNSYFKSRVLIFLWRICEKFFFKFSCKHIFLADLPVLCYIYYQQLDLFFNYKPCIYMKVESNLWIIHPTKISHQEAFLIMPLTLPFCFFWQYFSFPYTPLHCWKATAASPWAPP